jgi:hypothetical protein
MFRRNFLFGKDGGTANLIDVGSEDLYQPGKGYGFVTEKNRREQELLQIRELNSSFDTMYWYQNEQLSFLKEDENGCYLDSAEEVAALERQSGEPMSGSPRRIPLIFKVDVPRQGNYRIPDHPLRRGNGRDTDLHRKKTAGFSWHSGSR